MNTLPLQGRSYPVEFQRLLLIDYIGQLADHHYPSTKSSDLLTLSGHSIGLLSVNYLAEMIYLGNIENRHFQISNCHNHSRIGTTLNTLTIHMP